ncbi:MerR family transcriptional regulator [Fervidibacillus albus]|uniref:MerR family transcriptional regulator n=1 Tax=Fervidibacillus albus TaxID=2980026 RepID=A0A9E8RXB2_9BACI|nr:MerR family transcriptional regulator [Fervidibacillus albus]WAA10983.1 MerR family transcriptional regulator [Fervidibacillus albus]
MKIGQFAECTGISKDTIRYYEKIGLLQPEIQNKHREYNDDHVLIIETIIKLKDTGFSLSEIKKLFEWSENMDPNKKLTAEEMQNVLQMKAMFQNKYAQMVQRENNIKQIKEILLKAENKIEQLLERNKR